MNTILISYDLLTPGQKYTELHNLIINTYGTRCKPLESFWLVRTSETAEQVRSFVDTNILDNNDKIIAINVTGDGAAWRGLSEANGQWIKNNL